MAQGSGSGPELPTTGFMRLLDSAHGAGMVAQRYTGVWGASTMLFIAPVLNEYPILSGFMDRPKS